MEQYNWRIYASEIKNKKVLCIWKFNKIYSCDLSLYQKTHPQASKKLVANVVQDKLRDTPNFCDREIINDIRHDCGVFLTYQ